MLSIITSCANQETLAKLYESIDFDKVHQWIIVYDTTKIKTYPRIYAENPKILEVDCADEGKVGNAQRKYGISLVTEGFLYFLNTDTIVHPNLWKLVSTLDATRFYTFDQSFFRRDEFRTASDNIFRGDTCAPFKIDAGMYLVPISLVDDTVWAADKYNSDGLFIQDIYRKYPLCHTYISEVASYYSYITVSQLPKTIGGLQNIFFLSNVAPSHYPILDSHYTWIPIHGDIPFDRLSSLYHKYKPLAYVSYGENNWAALNKLANIRKRWVHLRELPTEYDICPVVFGALFPGRHSADSEHPVMSCITTTYHSGQKIQRPLRSLQSQSYPDWEWIVWDDSKDETTYKELLELQDRDMRIRVFKAPQHSGYIGEMKRLAGSLAQGALIVEIDHDDDFHPDLLKWIYDASCAHKDAGFFYTDCAELTEDTYEPAVYSDFFGMGYEMHVNVWSAFHNCYLASYNAAPPNALTLSHIVGVPNHVRAWRTEFYDRIGRHNALLSVADDYDLILRSYIEGTFCHIRAVGYYQYRNRDGNFTFLRNSLIQHNVKHIYDFYKPRLPLRDVKEPVKEQWRSDAITHPVTHTTYIPPEFRYETVIALIDPSAAKLYEEYTKAKDTGKLFHIFVIGELPTIPDELRPSVSWWNMKSKNIEERKNYVRRFLHTCGDLVFVD